jgi:hypothetical protein
MAFFFSLSLGLIAGAMAVAIWNALGRKLGDSEFWPGLRRLATRMVTGAAQQDFFREYVQLLRLLGRYLARTSIRVALTIVPVASVVVLLGPIAIRHEAALSDRIGVFPPQSGALHSRNRSLSLDAEGMAFHGAALPQGPVELILHDTKLSLPEFRGAVAVSNCGWTCLGLQLMGFDARHVEGGPALLVLRTSGETANPLWPWLGNLEFTFWSAVMAGSLVAGAVMACRRRLSHQHFAPARMTAPGSSTGGLHPSVS